MCLQNKGNDWVIVLSYLMGCVTISVLGTVGLQLQGEGVYCASTMYGTSGSFLVLVEEPRSWLFFLPEQGIFRCAIYLSFPCTSMVPYIP